MSAMARPIPAPASPAPVIAALQGERDDLCRMHRPAPGAIADLLPAAEPVRDHEPIGGRAANRREQHELAEPTSA